MIKKANLQIGTVLIHKYSKRIVFITGVREVINSHLYFTKSTTMYSLLTRDGLNAYTACMPFSDINRLFKLPKGQK